MIFKLLVYLDKKNLWSANKLKLEKLAFGQTSEKLMGEPLPSTFIIRYIGKYVLMISSGGLEQWRNKNWCLLT